MLNGIQQSLIASNTCGTKSRNLPADHTHVGLLIGTPMINNDDSDDDDDDDDHDHDDDHILQEVLQGSKAQIRGKNGQ